MFHLLAGKRNDGIVETTETLDEVLVQLMSVLWFVSAFQRALLGEISSTIDANFI